MGLCKCSLRRVTNLFCFEHRVNVCESCLISNHESCVVQTYVAWLTDSDYDPNCLLCSQTLHKTETVRLKCFHVFHWDCLNARMSQLPLNSSSFKCPSCLDNIFPSQNQTSPVIEKLKSRLSSVNWGRNGLGLEMRPEYDTTPQHVHQQQQSPHQHLQNPSSLPASGRATPALSARETETAYSLNIENPIEMNTFTSRSKGHAEDRRPLLNHNPHDEDHPDQKYAKRLGGDRHVNIRSVPRSVKRIAAIAIIAAVVIVIFLTIGRHSGNPDNNPLFDPHANPNIRIADS
jgi:hypothetical protein|uniref:Zinc finger protein-like 1 homolog n=1 Tax=Panagrolaimus sp. PS1159 TaxID=55785 RepID=A0AC35FXH6_9BILA